MIPIHHDLGQIFLCWQWYHLSRKMIKNILWKTLDNQNGWFLLISTILDYLLTISSMYIPSENTILNSMITATALNHTHNLTKHAGRQQLMQEQAPSSASSSPIISECTWGLEICINYNYLVTNVKRTLKHIFTFFNLSFKLLSNENDYNEQQCT